MALSMMPQWSQTIDLAVMWIDHHFFWIIAVMGGVLVLSLIVRPRRKRKSTGYGSARWATYQDVKRARLLKGVGQGIILGTFQGQPLCYRGDGHVALIGPTRSGKGINTVIPTLRTYRYRRGVPVSVVCIDIKGENYDATAKWRSEFSDVVVFEPASQVKRHCLELLSSIRWKTTSEVVDAQRIGDMIAAEEDPDVRPTGARVFYREKAAAFLPALILYLGHAHPQGLPCSFPGLWRLAQLPMTKVLQNMAQYPNSTVSGSTQQIMNFPVQERGKIWDAVTSLLTVFADPILQRHTEANDLSFEQLQWGERPVSLYLIVSPADLLRLRLVFRMIIEQIVVTATRRPLAQPRRNVLLLLDEFAALGRLVVFEKAMPFLAGYQVRCLIVLQSLNQLRQVYGPYNSILDNSQVRVIYAPNDDETAYRFSRMLGESTVQESMDGHSKPRFSLFWSSKFERQQAHGRPLLTAGELMDLPPDEEIVRIGGKPPIRAQKIAPREET
jgi:type IV secretion system protein VirD4